MRALPPVSIPRLLGVLTRASRVLSRWGRERPQTLALHALFAGGVLVLPGCGAAAASKADVPPPSATSVPNDVESAQSELDRGEWRITELFGPPGGGPSPVRPADEPASASPTASAAPAPAQAPKVAELSGGDGQKPEDACTVACSALASMGRAARHMCEMAGPDEPRCTSARERVQNATDRVAAHCTCGL